MTRHLLITLAALLCLGPAAQGQAQAAQPPGKLVEVTPGAAQQPRARRHPGRQQTGFRRAAPLSHVGPNFRAARPHSHLGPGFRLTQQGQRRALGINR
ncbi:MAG: hypothetical protein AAGF36_07380 [Pseudomonadota bacterium]